MEPTLASNAESSPRGSSAHPLPPTPRRIRASRRVRIIRGLLLVPMVVLPLLLEWAGRSDARDLQKLLDEGEVVATQVTGLHSRNGRSTDYYLDTAFILDERRYEVCDRVSRDRFTTTSVGDPVDVTFLPERPERARLDRVDEATIQRSLLGCRVGGGVLGFVFLFVLALVEWVNRKARRLLRTGDAVMARVVTTHPMFGDGPCGAHVNYRFRTADGTEVSGKSFLSPRLPDDVAAGVAMVALYDRERPSRNILLRAAEQVARID